MKKALAIVLALALALTLVACGGTPTSSSAPVVRAHPLPALLLQPAPT